ncbi:MAG: DUF805 domain-containing protein [Micrococcales bacterium]
MNFGQSIASFWRNYANFKGRTSRRGYWWAVLFLVLASSAVSILFPGHTNQVEFMGQMVDVRDNSAMENLWGLATLIPSIALSVRRLHDIGKSGHNLWFGLIPLVGAIMLLVWHLRAGEPVENKYGHPVN